jgi:phage terminase large subunit GpA-like protein
MFKTQNLKLKTQNFVEVWSERERLAWEPTEDLTVTQWAARGREMPAGSAFEGLYNPELTPEMRVPQDAFGDPEVEGIVLMTSVQASKSTAEENMLGFTIDREPTDIMVVVPREEDIEYTSQMRIKKMILSSPCLLRHTTGHPRDLQGDTFKLDRMNIYFSISGSPASVAGKNIRRVFLEEPDKFPPFSGREANPLDLVEKRGTTYWDFKWVLACTPTTKSGYTYQAWDWSNKQRLYIPCPKCGEYKVWRFEQLKIPKTLRDPDEIIAKNDVWYECEVCNNRIEEIEKPRLVKAGLWLPEGQSINANGNITGQPARTKRISGYQKSGLVSQFPRMSWSRIMAAWFTANTEEGIAQGKRMDFANNYMGEPFEQQGKQLRASDVRKLGGFFSAHTVPPDCILLTVGADYHKSEVRGIVRIDFEVRGFAPGGKNYVIYAGSAVSFDNFDDIILQQQFPWSDGTPAEKRPFLTVGCAFIDSGFEPDDVYAYCRKRLGLAIPTKGEAGPLLKPLRVSDLESATERRLKRRSRFYYAGMQLIIVDTYFFKNQVTSWAEPLYEEDAAGGKPKLKSPPLTQFYAEIESHYATEFTNEKLVQVRDKLGLVKYAWQPVYKGAATHFLDTAVLAAAAAHYKGIQYARPGGGAGEQVNRHKEIQRGGFLDDLPAL